LREEALGTKLDSDLPQLLDRDPQMEGLGEATNYVRFALHSSKVRRYRVQVIRVAEVRSFINEPVSSADVQFDPAFVCA
jgi:hypothetical protein